MGSVDDRTFRANFSEEGVAKLRERVKDKLKEFMGDYTDDTLVEYVIVLLRNGRRKEEARNELNVFLGDNSDSFVSWLWDHLSASLNMYLPSQDSYVEATKIKSTVTSKNANNDSVQPESESERGKSNKSSESRPNRQWRNLARNVGESPSRIISEAHNSLSDEKKDRKTRYKRSPSPQLRARRKRSRDDDRQHEQREANNDVPRRLLQFAVRDALATSKPSNSVKEPSLKRIRSMVSASTQDSSSVDPPRRLQSVARVLNPMAPVIKAVAEAADDVRKTKPGRSVFDRIGHSTKVSGIPEQHAEFREDEAEPEESEHLKKNHELIELRYPHRLGSSGGCDDSMETYGTGSGRDVMSGYKRLNNLSGTGHDGVSVPNSTTSAVNRDDVPINVQHRVAVQLEDFSARNDGQSKSMATATRQKIVNVPWNLNPRKPTNFQDQKEVADMDSPKPFQESKVGANEAIIGVMKENNCPVAVGNGNVKADTIIQRDTPKNQMSGPGTYSAIRPLEDADSRTIFVSNVHFGATKDSLSRHFNQFGEVLKVVILTDPATGQLTGSAYVEFNRKEAADNALSLNATSFMSRILKIVKRSSAQQEAAPTMTWSRATQGSSFSVPRFPRAASFPRGGVTGGFRGRPSIRPRTRSLQWKRDAPANAADAAASSGPGNSCTAPAARSLTYVRTGPKSDGNPGAAT